MPDPNDILTPISFTKTDSTGDSAPMTRAMVFIDGSWLYSSTPTLIDEEEDDFRIDFGKLPRTIISNLEERPGVRDMDLVRTHFFSSYATNYDPSDEEAVQKRLNFFSMLREKYHYNVEVMPVDFRGRPLSKEDRDPTDSFEPDDRSVNIALSSSMLYNAARAEAFDVAVCVLGDKSYKPVLWRLRQLGKRVAITSIRGTCDTVLSAPEDREGIRDYQVVWLDDLKDDIQLTYERHQLTCQSPMHEGDPEVWTTYHPREGENFYCSECREKYKKQQENRESDELEDLPGQDAFEDTQEGVIDPTQSGDVSYTDSVTDDDGAGTDSSNHDETGTETTSPKSDSSPSPAPGNNANRELKGVVKKKFPDRGYGFIRGNNGSDYFFHLSDLMFDTNFEDVFEGMNVEFMIKREPTVEEDGAATNVRVLRESSMEEVDGNR